MNHKNLLNQFFKPIKSISELIKVSNNKGIIIGGIAASLLGKPRFTADIDILILLQKDDINNMGTGLSLLEQYYSYINTYDHSCIIS